MSRFLFVVPPLTGHTNPTIGVARELAAAGHEVAWTAYREVVEKLLPPGARLIPVGPSLPSDLVGQITERSRGLRGPTAFKFLWEEFLHPLACSMVKGVEAAVEEFRPDVLVVDQQAFAGALVARRRAMRWATSATTSAEFTNPFEGLPKLGEWVAESLRGFQREFGVSEEDAARGDLRFSDHLVLIFSSRELVGADREFPPHYRFVGPSFAGRVEDVDSFPWAWLAEAPRVLVSLGTVNAEAGDRFFRAVIEGLGGRDLQVVLVAPPERIGAVPDNVLARARPAARPARARRRRRVARRPQHRLRGARARPAARRGADTRRPAGGCPAGRRGRRRGARALRARAPARHRGSRRRGSFAARLSRGRAAHPGIVRGRRRSGRCRARPRGARMLSALWMVTFLAILFNGLRLRGRARALKALAWDGSDGPDRSARAPGPDGGYALISASGVRVTAEVERAAIGHARREGLDVLDLVPADLPVERALDTLRLVDPATYRAARFADGAGGFQALLVARDVLERAAPSDLAAGAPLDPAAMLRVTRRLKPYACATTDVAVAPGLRASDLGPAQRLAWLRQLYQRFAPLSMFVQLVELVLLCTGPFARPFWGTLALAAYCAQPCLVFSGTALRPRDLKWQPLRPLLALWTWVRTALAGTRSAAAARIDPLEAAVPEYERLLADGTGRFFESRRGDCPWCGSTNLRRRLETGDFLQHKPGRFVLERCGACGHIFQNPRLSLAGLDFYYRDFYDGLSEDFMNMVFGAPGQNYAARAQMLAGLLEPREWLDVGAGHGHFCRVAKDLWPNTRFDGLDMSRSIEEAERRGWVGRGYRGMFPELAPRIEGAYDVVSMHHYLEHTREPLEELAAAARVVRPGGYCLIELPDPECPLGTALGRYWLPWFQPQHQHFIPLGNLQKALERFGFTVVKVDRASAHQAVDLGFAALAFLQQFAPPTHLPWRPAAGRRWPARIKRTALFAVAWPLLVAGVLGDQVLGFVIRRGGLGSNTYRVLARKERAARDAMEEAPPPARAKAAAV